MSNKRTKNGRKKETNGRKGISFDIKYTKWLDRWLNDTTRNQDGWWWGFMAGKVMVYPKEKRVDLLEIYASALIDEEPVTKYSRRMMDMTLKCIMSLGWKVDNIDRLNSPGIINPATHSVHINTKTNTMVFKHGTEDLGFI